MTPDTPLGPNPGTLFPSGLKFYRFMARAYLLNLETGKAEKCARLADRVTR